jgi:hypothetical protein
VPFRRAAGGEKVAPGEDGGKPELWKVERRNSRRECGSRGFRSLKVELETLNPKPCVLLHALRWLVVVVSRVSIALGG